VTCRVQLGRRARTARVTLRRGGRIVARGTIDRRGAVVLRRARPLAPGRYVLRAAGLRRSVLVR
jgi:transposase